jgi:hypothetical protein
VKEVVQGPCDARQTELNVGQLGVKTLGSLTDGDGIDGGRSVVPFHISRAFRQEASTFHLRQRIPEEVLRVAREGLRKFRVRVELGVRRTLRNVGVLGGVHRCGLV